MDNVSTKEKDFSEKQDIQDYLDYFISYFEEFYSFLPFPFCDLNPLFVTINVNKSFLDYFGYSKTEAIGNDLSFIFEKKQDFKKIKKEIEEREEINEKEYSVITKDKKVFKASISIKARRDKKGGIRGYFISFIDVTELKKLQEGLEQKIEERTKDLSNARMALMNMLEDVDREKRMAEEEKNKTLAILSNFADGILVFNEEKRLQLINPQAEKFFKIKESEVIGKSILELKELPYFKDLIKLTGIEFKDIFRQELSLRSKLILEASVVPIISKTKVSGFLIIVHDITREKMVEKIKTEFVSVAAHQLRTPLSAIKWTLKMILEGDVGEVSKEQKSFLEKSYISNERMIGLVNDLLDITRIEEGRYLYKPTLANFEESVNFVFDSFEEEFARKKINFEYNKPKVKIPKITMDVEKIKLVIHNLIDNAIKYTSPEGKVSASLDYDEENKEITFSVTDTGVGIPADQQSRLFTKFFRGANVIRMETEGSGFGLFISKNIIEAHNGKIWFKSKEGEGTTFYFSLPLKQEEFTDFLKGF